MQDSNDILKHFSFFKKKVDINYKNLDKIKLAFKLKLANISK